MIRVPSQEAEKKSKRQILLLLSQAFIRSVGPHQRTELLSRATQQCISHGQMYKLDYQNVMIINLQLTLEVL